jgi:hypothetical protein
MEYKFDTPSEGIKAKVGKNGKRLFNSQVELVADILKNNEDFKKKNALTVKSAINQVFTGERNLSSSLSAAIFQVLEAKFNKELHNFNEYKEVLIEKFRKVYEERNVTKRKQLGEKDYKNLVEITKKAKEILIITLEPAELYDSVLANRLKDELLEKIGIIPKTDEATKEGRYIFFIPRGNESNPEMIAKQFWEKLSRYAFEESELDQNEVNDLLKQANENKKVRTFLADKKLVTYPAIFLDYNSPLITGFCVSYQSQDNSLSVAQLSYDVIFAWKELIYTDLLAISKNENNEFKFKSIMYE